MDRRGFLKFAAGGTVGLVASPIIWNTLYDAVYWTQNWGWIPRLKKGESQYVPTVSKLCPSGTGFLVRTVGGVPVTRISSDVLVADVNQLAAEYERANAERQTQHMRLEDRIDPAAREKLWRMLRG